MQRQKAARKVSERFGVAYRFRKETPVNTPIRHSNMKTDATTADAKRYQGNLRDELDGAALYTEIAAERDPIRRDLFLALTQAETRHARCGQEHHACAENDRNRRYGTSSRIDW